MKIEHYKSLYDNEIKSWWYRVRRSLVSNIIKRYTKRNNLNILDVGCGTGALMLELSRFGNISGIDMAQTAIDFCKSRGINNVRLGNALDIPYEDNSFDVVLALDVIEHIKEDELAMRELKRVLKPNGILITFVPAFMILWGITDVISEHFTRYKKKDFKKKILSSGLDIVRISYFNFFLFIPILIVRKIVNLFNIKVKNENNMTPGIINTILYSIFSIELVLLNYINLPLGVSLFCISKKK